MIEDAKSVARTSSGALIAPSIEQVEKICFFDNCSILADFRVFLQTRYVPTINNCYSSNMLKLQNICHMQKQSSTDVFDS